jgi:hypothetical protein
VSTTLPVIEPIAPMLIAKPFHRDGWINEEKVDGWRMVVQNPGNPATPRHGSNDR